VGGYENTSCAARGGRFSISSRAWRVTPFAFKVRYAETFVKMPDGKWQCIMSAGVPMK